MTITGEIIIGSALVRGAETYQAIDPSTGQALDPPFSAAGAAEVDRACALAWAAFPAYRELDREARAKFLETIADNIMALGDELIVRAMAESGLPRGRLEGERGRTIGQLRLFATVVRQGDWLGVRIDPAMPERKPLPRSDIRLRKIPLGPVAVFGASNFPLAFSVAGGDTASALAAGCPVVVKGHPAHPGTGELVGRAIQKAVKDCGLPEGVFSLVGGPSHELSGALVRDARIKAVGFTGSRGAGLALAGIVASRPEPIPIYAEMSSVNPVFLLPEALKARAEALGQSFVGSLTMGAGQFCTNPGLIFAVDGPDLDRFMDAASQALAASLPSVMLTPGIHKAYEQGVDKLAGHGGVRERVRAQTCTGANQGRGVLFETDLATFQADPALAHEVFGSSSLVVRCPDAASLPTVIAPLEGQLTATLHMDAGDQPLAARLIPELELRAGRILANGWPTGVEVSHAMVHGGPFPATSDSRSTSVGTLAIERFLRPVSYQDIPQALLPDYMRDGEQTVRRLVDGAWV
ncbi:aldehyde dehydrogenase (NADP(+)) [Caulobacter sp. S45]|uniref:aldehyde dehydrogenase (NADP(+)) n=1 Tax=Caulobacter sp. S45 TaxID=1641861 RepID=UPI0020B175C2|nr:aldehyde dehydrogenase (NADP(+)) [Caulobacter sp. S45]